jgi:hypothetical protein
MPRVYIVNKSGSPIFYKMDIDATSSGPGKNIPASGHDGPFGDYALGTPVTVWWKKGVDAEVRTCVEAGCNPGKFKMPSTDVSVNLGEDVRFPEQKL